MVIVIGLIPEKIQKNKSKDDGIHYVDSNWRANFHIQFTISNLYIVHL